VTEAQDAQNQEVAPTHQDVRNNFTELQIAICVGLGSIAIAAGIVLGIVLAND